MQGFIIIFGILIAGLVDAFWRQKNIDSDNKFLKAHEHFHVGIEFGILAMIVSLFEIQFVEYALWGLAVAFVFSEFTHFGWFKGDKFVVSHPFAFGSEHFKGTHLITIGLCIIGFLLYFYLSELIL